MEPILHMLGLCGDNHSHLDLLDLLVGGTSLGVVTLYLKYYFIALKYMVKDFLTKNNSKNKYEHR